MTICAVKSLGLGQFYHLFCLCMLIAHTALAQRETYGYTTYTPPKGWQKTTGDGWVAYHTENKAQNSMCRMWVYQGFANDGTPRANFDHFWGQLVAIPYKTAQKPEIKTEQKDGWTIVAGGVPVNDQGYPYVGRLTVITGHGVTVPYFFLYDNDDYVADIQQFLEKMDVKKLFISKPPSNQPTDGNSTTSTNQSKPPANSSGGQHNIGNAFPSGIAKFTTHFDDGWIATPQAEFVLVQKQNISVMVYYPDKSIYLNRPSNLTLSEYCLQLFLNPMYDITSTKKWSGVTYPPIDYIEGIAIDKKSGKQVFYAITQPNVTGDNSAAVVAIAPNQDILHHVFPEPRSLDRMVGYNKFAVTQQDIIGTWSSNGGGSVDYYSAYTGNYAGYSAFSSATGFIFSTNGTYQSTHNSANTELSGATKFAGIKYNGNFTVADWALTASNRYQGKTDNYECSFRAIKGGFLLMLKDTGNNYSPYILVKSK